MVGHGVERPGHPGRSTHNQGVFEGARKFEKHDASSMQPIIMKNMEMLNVAETSNVDEMMF